MHEDEDNDGRFPDESPVEVRYPRSKQEEQGDRSAWPWLPGSLLEPCGPDGGDVSRAKLVRVRAAPAKGEEFFLGEPVLRAPEDAAEDEDDEPASGGEVPL